MGSGFRNKRTGQQKNVPYLSHEFIIQNHGDIVTCIFMVFIVGLMFQITSPLASVFIIPGYNLTEIDYPRTPVFYTYGFKDVFLVLFYSLAAIIIHAVIQEYVLDKLNKRMKLSKTKSSRFNDSGQLVVFYGVSAFWLLNIFNNDGYFRSYDFFWNGYPHIALTFWTKMFFIIQLSYWFHSFPELYFQKVKKEEIVEKVQFAIIYLIAVLFIYLLNFSRVGLVLLFIDYFQNFVFHTARLLHFTGKQKTGKFAFSIYNLVFFAAKVLSGVVAVLVFLYGLQINSVSVIDRENGNFNTPLTRYTFLAAVLALQLWQVWDFIRYKFNKRRDARLARGQVKAKQATSKKVKGTSSETSDNEGQELSNDESQIEGSPSNGKVKAN